LTAATPSNTLVARDRILLVPATAQDFSLASKHGIYRDCDLFRQWNKGFLKIVANQGLAIGFDDF